MRAIEKGRRSEVDSNMILRKCRNDNECKKGEWDHERCESRLGTRCLATCYQIGL